MKDNILSELLTECPFSEVFEDMETVEGCSFPVPRRKIGHFRADYDGWRWYNTVWPCHKALATPEVCAEIDRVYDELIAPGALKDLAALRKFCADHMDACISKEYEDEFSFYYVGERCNFWIRLITRRRDYNMYLNAYIKEHDNQKYFDYLERLRQSGETNMYGAGPICKPSFLSFAMIETRQEIFSWRGSEPLIRGRTARHAEALSDH